jgi:hypothetical protein
MSDKERLAGDDDLDVAEDGSEDGGRGDDAAVAVTTVEQVSYPSSVIEN